MTDGRFRATREPSPAPQAEPADSGPATSVLDGTSFADHLGERATLVQFSSAFCAPCRTTRVVLDDVAGREAGVRHVEIDAEKHLDLVRALDVRRTPTTLIRDHAGRELTRAAGAPQRTQVLAALQAGVAS